LQEVITVSGIPGGRPSGYREGPAVRLSGTGRLADDMYLMAHSDLTGRPHLQPRATGLGLAGAMLAELLLAGVAWLGQDAVVETGTAWPRDELARSVLRRVRAEPEPLPAREWLLFLARTAAGELAGRLAEAGYVRPAGSVLPWRPARWLPVDADCAFAPLVRVKSALGSPGTAPAQDLVLTGLAVACGLGPHLAAYLPPRALSGAAAVVRGLDPCLRDLIAQTQAAVDSAVLSQRVRGS
jgi:hypothetical protein